MPTQKKQNKQATLLLNSNATPNHITKLTTQPTKHKTNIKSNRTIQQI